MLVVVAVITACASLLVSVVGAVLGYRNAARLQADRNAQEEALERLRTELRRSTSEADARLDYEYEARKRLYQACEPLFFQLGEKFEDAHGRTVGIARTARLGKLEPGSGWLYVDGYFLRSTLYRLVAPVALFQLLQEQMTAVDLSVDPGVHRRYLLAKRFAGLLTDHFDLAAAEPAISYTPHDTGDDAVRTADQPRFWTQGVNVGDLDTAARSLIVRDGERSRVVRFGEFDDLYEREGSDIERSFSRMVHVLYDFHPRTRPVLWRILVTQSLVCTEFAQLDAGSGTTPDGVPADGIYDWRQPGEPVDDGTVDEPVRVATAHLRRHLGTS